MTTHANPKVDANLPNVPDVGQIAFNRHVFDIAVGAGYRPAAIAENDLIQIGVVPAGHVLIPHLSRLSWPALEGGTPASDYTIGTAASPAILKGSAASETAVVLFGEDWLVPATPIGARDADTPIYAKIITAAFHTIATTGQIVFEPVYRPWRADLDG